MCLQCSSDSRSAAGLYSRFLTKMAQALFAWRLKPHPDHEPNPALHVTLTRDTTPNSDTNYDRSLISVLIMTSALYAKHDLCALSRTLMEELCSYDLLDIESQETYLEEMQRPNPRPNYNLNQD